MWHTFKFFFVWFWLGVAAMVFWWSLIALTTSGPMTADLAPGSLSGGALALVLGAVTAFLMSIPSYFIARPKRQPVDEEFFVR